MLNKYVPNIEKSLMLAVALLGVVLVALGLFGNNGIITYTELKRGYNDMQQRVDKLNRENEKLMEEINALRNDPTYIERIAREELGMVRPGEVLYRVRQGGTNERGK
jgi:cell division protein FtsB